MISHKAKAGSTLYGKFIHYSTVVLTKDFFMSENSQDNIHCTFGLLCNSQWEDIYKKIIMIDNELLVIFTFPNNNQNF